MEKNKNEQEIMLKDRILNALKELRYNNAVLIGSSDSDKKEYVLLEDINRVFNTILKLHFNEPDPCNIDEAVKIIYTDWGLSKEPQFLNQVKSTTEENFAIDNHHGLGTMIRNSFGLWKGDSKLSKHLKELGYAHPDDMSQPVLIELHRYAKQKLNL